MEEDILKIQRIFSGVLPHFSYSHAKVYCALLASPAKEGRQIISETRLSKPLVYKVLGELIEFGLIRKLDGAVPAYHNCRPVTQYNSFARKQIKMLEEHKNMLKQIAGKKEETTATYIVEEDRNGNSQIVNSKTKTVIREREEIRKLKSTTGRL